MGNSCAGQRLGYQGLYRMVKELGAIAGIEALTPHRLRHTFATMLLLRGMDSLHARTLTRHKSEATFQRYTKRAKQWAAEHSFYAIIGEPHPQTATAGFPVQEPEEEPGFDQASAGRSPTVTPQLYQLKAMLLGVRPQVWRRFQVQQTLTLAQLHCVLQIVMGWEGYHLHQFSLTEDESLPLQELLGDELFTFSYLYDFGDMWQHEVTVEKVLVSEPSKFYPVCLAGKRACPPEDCGGDWGYAHLLKVLKHPRHPDYRERREWIGNRFDPEAFDLIEVNQRLRELELEVAADSSAY